MQYNVDAAPASMSLATTVATFRTTLSAAASTGLSEMLEMFEATQPGWVSWLTTGEFAARRLRSNSRPHNITASLDRLYAPIDVHLPVRRCMSSSRSSAVRCACDPTLMIFERTRGKTRFVSANGPSMFWPICFSNPSTVSSRCCVSPPALLIRMSTSPSSASAKARTDDRSARSTLRDRRRTADLLGALRAELGVAHRHDHVRTRPGQRPRGTEPDAV